MSEQVAERLRSDNWKRKEDEKSSTSCGGYKPGFGGSPFLFSLEARWRGDAPSSFVLCARPWSEGVPTPRPE